MKLIRIVSVIITTTLPDTNATLVDYAAMYKADEGTRGVGEFIMMAAEQNEILQDMVFMECNDGTKHKSVIIPGLPEPTFRKLYGFVQPSRVQGIPISDNCAELSDYLQVDKKLADLNGNSVRFLMSQAKGISEGFNKKVASSLFYANEATQPEAFTGFAPRFNSLSANNAQNIIDAAEGAAVPGVLGNTSIWVINWDDYACHGIFPKGTKAGLQIVDKGQVTIQDTSVVDGVAGGLMEGYRTHFEWNLGLAVPDWRNVVRIANIDVSALTKNANAGADLIDLITQALEQIQSTNGKAAVYCSRTIRSFLRRQIANKVAASTLTMDTVAGKRVVAFDGIPVRRCDAIINTEDAVA
jgi:major capsid protein gp7